ncbi:flavodoxin family protein [Bradyrhizobium xenonodulans]|uniref:Flavodoxin family protein n=1 Tax=Bradyrhizobium xenonodulans TaxID=2736875 RepID=A0ABY7MBN3_9BRAD|nr:flavodoxin family protein [Bradyrhizobium xenonodulans]WBL75720.1 flavodoxin family protein [Bradyrhizobium xenonodulans]
MQNLDDVKDGQASESGATMPLLAVVYFSISGTTEKLAHALARGAAGMTEIVLCRIMGDDIVSGRFQNEGLLETLDGADAVAFGSPTYMGGPAAQFKAFADASSDRWSKQAWANKIAAGFTTGACASGDQLHTLSYFSILAAQHGMLWCGLDIPGGEDPSGRNRLGSQLGLATHLVDASLPQSDLSTAEYLGQRLAKMASRNG